MGLRSDITIITIITIIIVMTIITVMMVMIVMIVMPLLKVLALFLGTTANRKPVLSTGIIKSQRAAFRPAGGSQRGDLCSM